MIEANGSREEKDVGEDLQHFCNEDLSILVQILAK